MTDVSGRVPRTSSWHDQPGFDKLLADLKISGLIFLRDLYNREIRDFPHYFNMEDELCQREYLAKIRRHSMINDELRARHEYYEPDLILDNNDGCVYDSDNNIVYGVYFSENESTVLSDNGFVNTPTSIYDETDYTLFKEGDMYYQYSKWDYWKDEDESA